MVAAMSGRRSAALYLAMLTASCAVGPDFHRPAPPTASGYAPPSEQSVTRPTIAAPGVGAGGSETFVLGRDIRFAWWQGFGSAKLDALVARALANSPTLAAAKAALRAAHAQTAAQRGFFFPTVSGDFTASRQRISGNLSSNDPGLQGNGTNLSAPPAQPLIYTFYTTQLGLGFAPDVFGATRRSVESLKAQEDMTRFQMEAAYTTLTTNVVAAALQEAALGDEIGATQAYIATNARALDILHAQQRAGFVARLEVAQQEAALAQAQALLPPLVKQREQTRDLIRALAGGMASDAVEKDFSLAQFTLPAELPLSLPARLIDQRPDLRAAEAQWHAAQAQVGVAVAARLPQFTITGAYGGAANSVSDLFKTGAPFWNVIGGVTQTIFDGGTLAHKQHAAQALRDEAAAQYRATLIAAVQNVADTLHAIQADAEGLAAAARAEAATRAARDTTRAQYRAGYVNYQALLLAEGAYQQAVVNRVQGEANRLGDAAALYQALGGGWWNRTAAQEATSPNG